MTPDFHGTVESDHAEQGAVPSGVSVVFPRAAALDANAAMDRLLEAFPDHEPSLMSESEDCWVFRLNWTSDARAFVDPRVPSTAESLFGLTRSEIGSHCKVYRWGERDVVISMVHSWALLAAAKAIERRGNLPLSWVVHVDDHTDLMGSLVEPLSRPGSLRDHIFAEDIDLGKPSSVIAAVRRGAVSKGNFLTAYLLAYPGCRTVHIGSNLTEQDFRLSHHLETTELGGRRFTRYEFMLDPPSKLAPWTFRQKRSLPISLPIGEQEGVWLDIDLDYFWNRYNGDSDRRSEVALPNERENVMRRVDHFLTELDNVKWLTHIEAVSIAVSPGFFPAEYWAEVIPAVREGIRTKLGA